MDSTTPFSVKSSKTFGQVRVDGSNQLNFLKRSSPNLASNINGI